MPLIDDTQQQDQRRQPEVLRQPEADHAQAEAGHREQQHAAGIAVQWVAGQPQPHAYRTQRRHRAQDAQPFRAVVQDFVQERRQHRHHATQQHREHVQRHRADHDPVAHHEARAFGDAPEDRRGRAGVHRFFHLQRGQAPHRHQREDGGHRIGQALASEADQHAAQCRTGHHAGLEHHGTEAGATRELVAGQHAGEQGVVDR
ncbi:hypothetical protein G6F65_015202 [Rhizopus arrhizus]|nr:hypothetical protein G6F65_015202 [Rhizopus arrhizus]